MKKLTGIIIVLLLALLSSSAIAMNKTDLQGRVESINIQTGEIMVKDLTGTGTVAIKVPPADLSKLKVGDIVKLNRTTGAVTTATGTVLRSTASPLAPQRTAQ